MDMKKKTICIVLFLTSLGTSFLAIGQDSGTGDTGASINEPYQLESEEEIWEFFEKLCEVAPTKRCESDQISRVRNGEAVEDAYYDPDKAFKSKNEIIDAALALLEQQQNKNK